MGRHQDGRILEQLSGVALRAQDNSEELQAYDDS